MSAKFERAAYAIVQHIKDRFAKNVPDLSDWKQLNERQRQLLASVFYGSVDQGYEAAYQKLVAVHDDELLFRSGFTTIPDQLLDVSTDILLKARQGKQDVAAFTITKDEPFFLERWCAYYAHQFGEHNVYVLDNGTTDDSVIKARTRWPNINFVSFDTKSSCDWQLITNTAKCFQRVLLRAYYAVIYGDVDEFLITGSDENLRDFCLKFLSSHDDCIKSEGWGVVQRIGIEQEIGNQGLLESRDLAWRAPRYDKISLSKIPLDWSKGSHNVNNPVKFNEGLILLHARDIDVGIFYDHCRHRSLLENVKAPSFQGTTDYEQVIEYFKTRIASWQPDSIQYTTESRHISDHWRIQFKAAGM